MLTPEILAEKIGVPFVSSPEWRGRKHCLLEMQNDHLHLFLSDENGCHRHITIDLNRPSAELAEAVMNGHWWKTNSCFVGWNDPLEWWEVTSPYYEGVFARARTFPEAVLKAVENASK